MLSSQPRRGFTNALSLSAIALVCLAGLPVSAWGDEPQPVSGGSGSHGGTAAPGDDAKPGTYSVIDGKKAAIPEIPMGDPATVAKIIAEGKNNNRVMDHLSYISESIGPRLTGSSNVEKANKWARDQFEKWGLSIPPFGGVEGQTSGDHDLRGLWQWGTVSMRFDRGPSTGKVVAQRNPGVDNPEYRTVRDMEFTTQAWAPGTKGPVRAPVVKMPESDEQFEANKDKYKGAWILVKANQPGRRGAGGVMGGASARMALFNDIRKKWKSGEAAEEKPVDKNLTHYEGTFSGGAGGMPEMAFALDVNLTDPKKVTGTISVGRFGGTDLQNGTYNEETHELKFKTETPRGEREYTLKVEGDTLSGKTVLPDDGGTITYSGKKVEAETPRKGPTLEEKVLALEPAGWIVPSNSELVLTGGVQGWDKLEMDKVAKDVIVTVRKSDYDCMNSNLVDGSPIEAEFDLPHTFTPGPIPVYDTIAEIKGTEKPDEIVIVSGHLDSWNGPGSQGTTDNGTGSAVTLEAARILAASGAKPKRTIRFILWTGEEQGLLGSVAYVKYLKEHGGLEKISAVLVDDGGTNYEGGLPCVESEVAYLAAATAPVNGHFYSETDKKFLDVNIHARKTFTQVQGSDHNSFMREKVPGFFWDEEGRADYNYTHHTQHDHLSAAIPEYLKQSATCAAVTAYNLACAPELLPRPTDEEWPRSGRGGGGQGGRGQGGQGGRGAGRPGGAGGTPAPDGDAPVAPGTKPSGGN